MVGVLTEPVGDDRLRAAATSKGTIATDWSAALIGRLRGHTDHPFPPGMVTLTVCPRGDHLRAAQRWREECRGCGEPITAGAVGAAAMDVGDRCGIDTFDFRHSCGVDNPPTEATITIDPAHDAQVITMSGSVWQECSKRLSRTSMFLLMCWNLPVKV